MWLTMFYGYHIWLEVSLIQVKDDDDLSSNSVHSDLFVWPMVMGSKVKIVQLWGRT